MVAYVSTLDKREKQALLIMFGPIWQKRFWSLDGQKGRPSLSDCIDSALRRRNKKSKEDLVDFLEKYLADISRRCEDSALRE